VSTEAEVSLKLSLKLRGKHYLLTVTPESFKLVLKGKREAIELPWTAFLDDDAAMLSALHASMRKRFGPGK
jgi:hypothetical protein